MFTFYLFQLMFVLFQLMFILLVLSLEKQLLLLLLFTNKQTKNK